MHFIDLTCPHCNANKVIFDMRSGACLPQDIQKLFCQCRNCRDVVVVSGTFTNGIPDVN